jgi:hypothetical protein
MRSNLCKVPWMWQQDDEPEINLLLQPRTKTKSSSAQAIEEFQFECMRAELSFSGMQKSIHR